MASTESTIGLFDVAISSCRIELTTRLLICVVWDKRGSVLLFMGGVDAGSI